METPNLSSSCIVEILFPSSLFCSNIVDDGVREAHGPAYDIMEPAWNTISFGNDKG
jgi:hypothetical protein